MFPILLIFLIYISIVAVHGLNGDAFRTWTAKSNNICWLSNPEFLTKYVKRARVLTWGYNANVSSLKGRSTSADRILQHAQTFVAQLHADRDVSDIINDDDSRSYMKKTNSSQLDDANDRPIIFLCHSLGGIIVKRVSKESRRPRHQIVNIS